MNLIKKGLIASAALLTLSLVACKKEYLDRVPSGQVVIDSVFTDISGAKAAVQGLNRLMYRVPNDGREETFGQKGIDLMMDIMGDDIAWSGFGANWFIDIARFQSFRNGASPFSYTWTFYYSMINNANRIIFHVDEIENGSDEEKAVIKAQALTYRAFAYFNLVQLYAFPYPHHKSDLGVPIYTEPTREGKARSTVQEVYDLVVSDLTSAESLFDIGPDPRNNVSDVNKSVAQGILARVYLTMYNFDDAATYANKARASYSLMNNAQLLSGFNLSNGEWMWGSLLNDEQSTPFKSFLSHMDFEAQGYSSLGAQKLVNRFMYRNQIDTNDVRINWWLADAEGAKVRYNQVKFRIRTPGSSATDLSYMRAAEMYLIEAEALAVLGQTGPAAALIEELVSQRFPGYSVAGLNQIELIKEITLQRRIELWGEGLRYLDIKRQLYYGATNNRLPGGLVVFTENELGIHRELAGGNSGIFGGAQNATVSPFVGGAPHPLFRARIPGSEINANPNMVQNP